MLCSNRVRYSNKMVTCGAVPANGLALAGHPIFTLTKKNSFDVLQILGGKSWPGALLHPEWYDSAPEVNEAEETLQLFLIEQLHERLPGWSTASRVKAANAFINILKDLKE